MKEVIMEVTVPLLIPIGEDDVQIMPEGYVQKFTENDIGYLIKETKIEE